MEQDKDAERESLARTRLSGRGPRDASLALLSLWLLDSSVRRRESGASDWCGGGSSMISTLVVWVKAFA